MNPLNSNDESSNISESSTVAKKSFFRPGFLTNKCSELKRTAEALNHKEKESGITQAPTCGLVHLAPAKFASESDSSSASTQVASNYVFGQNISSRTKNTLDSASKIENLWSSTFDNNDDDKSEKIVTTLNDNYFTHFAKVYNKSSATPESSFIKNQKSLSESAEEAFKKQSSMLQIDKEIEVTTGEENEVTVNKCSCRLYVMEGTNWSNLGLAYLHINDPKDSESEQKSRLIVRITPTLRVIINTAIYKEISIQLADPRSIRIGIIDQDKKAKVYLLVLQAHSVQSIYESLIERRDDVIKKAISNSSSQESKSDTPIIVNDDENDSLDNTSYRSRSDLIKCSTTMNQPIIPHFRESALTSTVKNLENKRICKVSDSSSNEYSSTPLRAGLKRPCKDSSDGPTATRPILGSNIVKNLTYSSSDSSQHVFGQNLQNRISNAVLAKGATMGIWNGSTSSENSPNELFSQLAKNLNRHEESKKNALLTNNDNGHENGETLEEAAARFQAEKESRVIPILGSNNTDNKNVTGEEEEDMAIRTYCKVFFLNSFKKVWESKGNVYLHVNDYSVDDTKRSRVVARVQKTHRLIVNSPIFEKMKIDLSDEKSIRCVIMNNIGSTNENSDSTEGALLACLFMFKNPNDAQKLFEVLLERVSRCQASSNTF